MSKSDRTSTLLATIFDGHFYKNRQTLTEIRRECTIFAGTHEPAIRKSPREFAEVRRSFQRLAVDLHKFLQKSVNFCKFM